MDDVAPPKPKTKRGRPRKKKKRQPLPAIKDAPAKRGRKSVYKPEYCDWAFRFALLGLTDAKISELIGINIDTYYDWQKKYPEFSDAIWRGKEPADALAAEGLHGRTYDRVVKTQQVERINVGNGRQELKTVEVQTFVPADPRASARWLELRRRGRDQSFNGDFRPQTTIEHNGQVSIAGADGKPVDENDRIRGVAQRLAFALARASRLATLDNNQGRVAGPSTRDMPEGNMEGPPDEKATA
jgi:hypothetical protein